MLDKKIDEVTTKLFLQELSHRLNLAQDLLIRIHNGDSPTEEEINNVLMKIGAFDDEA